MCENCAATSLSPVSTGTIAAGCVMLLVAAVVFADRAMSFPLLSMAEAPLSWMCTVCGVELAFTSFRYTGSIG